MFLLCGRFCINLKVFQSSASAPSHKIRGCSEKHLITLDPTSWSVKEVSMRRTRQSDYRALTLSLSHRSLTVGLRYSPWYVRSFRIRCVTWVTRRTVLRVIRKESRKILISHRVVDQLSPHHDSQFLAFSTEVLDQMNRKHNRSSSPFTTLPDRAERKVARQEPGNPTIDQRHNSELIHIVQYKTSST